MSRYTAVNIIYSEQILVDVLVYITNRAQMYYGTKNVGRNKFSKEDLLNILYSYRPILITKRKERFDVYRVFYQNNYLRL